MSNYGDKPFGLREVIVVNMAGTLHAHLNAAQTLTFKEKLLTGELRGNDAIKSLVAIAEGAEWKLDEGGVNLDTWSIMTGRTVTTAGATPAETKTLTGSAGDVFPYFKIYGKVVSEDSTSDMHAKLWKAKVQGLEGEFKGGEFWITKCEGVALDDGTNGIWDFVENETAASLPTT